MILSLALWLMSIMGAITGRAIYEARWICEAEKLAESFCVS